MCWTQPHPSVYIYSLSELNVFCFWGRIATTETIWPPQAWNIYYLVFIGKVCQPLLSHTIFTKQLKKSQNRPHRHPPGRSVHMKSPSVYCRRNKGRARSEDAGDKKWLWILSWGSMVKSIVKGLNVNGQVSAADTLFWVSPYGPAFSLFLRGFGCLFQNFIVTFFSNKTSLNSNKIVIQQSGC